MEKMFCDKMKISGRKIISMVKTTDVPIQGNIMSINHGKKNEMCFFFFTSIIYKTCNRKDSNVRLWMFSICSDCSTILFTREKTGFLPMRKQRRRSASQ